MDAAKRLKQTLSRGANAEALVALEVMRMAQVWEKRYQAEAGGKEIGPWLQENVDPRRGLSWYERRARSFAVWKSLGVAKYMEPKLQCWAAAAILEEKRAAAAAVLREACRDENDEAPLTQAQGSRLCGRFVTKRKSRQFASEELKDLRAKNAMLEALLARRTKQIVELGAKPVD